MNKAIGRMTLYVQFSNLFSGNARRTIFVTSSVGLVGVQVL